MNDQPREAVRYATEAEWLRAEAGEDAARAMDGPLVARLRARAFDRVQTGHCDRLLSQLLYEAADELETLSRLAIAAAAVGVVAEARGARREADMLFAPQRS